MCRVFQCGGLGKISGRHSYFLQMRTRKMELLRFSSIPSHSTENAGRGCHSGLMVLSDLCSFYIWDDCCAAGISCC